MGTALADEYLPIRLNGDLALFQAIGALLVGRRAPSTSTSSTATPPASRPGATTSRDLDWDAVLRATGLPRAQIERVADLFAASRAHRHLLGDGHHPAPQRRRDDQGDHQRRAAPGQHRQARAPGLCPVRGHSNVQGDRTMGIWEKLPPHFAERLRQEFGFDPPTERGHDVVNTVRAMKDGAAKVLFGLGGNFAAATPDSEVDPRGDARRSTSTCRSRPSSTARHVRPGRADAGAALPRAHREGRAAAAGWQGVTRRGLDVERAPLGRAATSRPARTCAPSRGSSAASPRPPWARCRRGRGSTGTPWPRTTPSSAATSATSCPGCDAYDEKVKRPGWLRAAAPAARHPNLRHRRPGRAEFAVSPLEVLEVPDGHLLLQTLRSHDQFNTTIYGHDDRYRGLAGGRRRRAWCTPTTSPALGCEPEQLVDVVSAWTGRLGAGRPRLPRRVVPHVARVRRRLLPRVQRARAARLGGDAAATARRRSRSSSGSSRPGTAPPHDAHGGVKAGSDHTHRSGVEPTHLS